MIQTTRPRGVTGVRPVLPASGDRADSEDNPAVREQHLADPVLTPQTIAYAHHISLGHLQQLLAEDETSPGAWIRRRLERCRHDLANPRLNAHPIRAIAERWGFTNPTHFSRLFRATYGIGQPTEFVDQP
ncbi:helix-turn-helix transcriptional regulator [Streptomyces sp. NBS 14/10]|uniref:helix-turn-helix transcriptional regulator n=1 Tax=Streptomyces sp. NBS 14/10 TaxID=1945643 RepID=UPI000B7FE55D|nr:helix-turn-helix transcriptional regulator [Streptomyces sp. NBS 14/10]KAK1184489.1 helix-turn-helix transcriptional regulator [Streptomyces sp. NBS 14/10]